MLSGLWKFDLLNVGIAACAGIEMVADNISIKNSVGIVSNKKTLWLWICIPQKTVYNSL